ncbi:uncharacterized protein HD556DRAFT_1505337 [Suillus plorans]|uniref:Uncharacterized protein n=1 Tax=Suillus plorans TaxID=116603 RepID=A0A9P7DBK9_9AGAM|nr:uncharacterized protein HD556DRAFT_1505337 [Suillus plorans]KAG1786712.1 hypothetical protein HD556DRAFT_1505337 [Suillus plorans]
MFASIDSPLSCMEVLTYRVCATSPYNVFVDSSMLWRTRAHLGIMCLQASFELGPMVYHGEILRTFKISVRELPDHSERSHPIVFQPKQEDVVSACTSLFMTVKQRLSDQNDGGVLCSLTTLTSCDMDGLAVRTDAGHPLFNLATAKFTSCKANGRYLDLDVPISLFQDALDLRPTGHPDRPTTQLHLAIYLLSRFAKRGFQTDASMGEELLSDVLDVYHADSQFYRAALIALNTSAAHGCMDANDLQQERSATSILPLSPNQLARRAEWCLQRDEPRNLAVMLHTRFERRGNDKDLDQAIALQTERLALCPYLATQLSSRFHYRGNDEDLDEVITRHREMLTLRPVGHTDRSSSLYNLANLLSLRFDRRGNDEDLDQASALHREALALLPLSHTDRSKEALALVPVGHTGNDEDLDEAIALHREALALCPVGHTYRPSSLNNLANLLSLRFDRRGNDEDLDEAIALDREALALRPVGHTDQSGSLNDLANILYSRFDHRGNREDPDESLENLRCALTLLTQHDPRQLLVHKALARVYLSFHLSGPDGTGAGEDTECLNVAMHHFKEAANVVSGGLLSRLQTSLLWVHLPHYAAQQWFYCIQLDNLLHRSGYQPSCSVTRPVS